MAYGKPGRPRVSEKPLKQKPFLEPGSRTVTASIEKMILSKKSPVDMQELAVEFYNQVGGARGFIARVLANYNKTEKGSSDRVRMLEVMMKLFSLGRDSAGSLEEASDEDLESLAREMMIKMRIPGAVENGWIDHYCI